MTFDHKRNYPPTEKNPKTKHVQKSAVIIAYDSMPRIDPVNMTDAYESGFQQGKTLVHETGHW
jgi:hypothetical protein